jgi:hypothetical protein
MRQSVEAMNVALRVLGAITAGCQPDWGDIQELHRLAPSNGDMPLDQVACLVVEKYLKHYRIKREIAFLQEYIG